MARESDSHHAFPEQLGEGFFRRLVTKAHFELCRVAMNGRADPLDLAEEVLIQIFQLWSQGKLETTDPTALMRGLAGTMLHHRAIDASRRAAARQHLPAPHSDPDMVGSSIALDRFHATFAGITTHIRRLVARERVTKILDFVADLEKRDPGFEGSYELLVLRLVDGIPYREIADLRGKGETADAIRWRVRRLKRLVRERFPAFSEED